MVFLAAQDIHPAMITKLHRYQNHVLDQFWVDKETGRCPVQQ